MPAWVIRCYGYDRRGVFDNEYRGQSPAVRAELRAVLNLLRHQPSIEGWSRLNGFDRLGSEYRQLGKLLFRVAGVQHRPLGFFGPGDKTFTLLAWATEKNWTLHPPGIRDTAVERMKATLAEPLRAHEFHF